MRVVSGHLAGPGAPGRTGGALLLAVAMALVSCAHGRGQGLAAQEAPVLSDLRQLTFGGVNDDPAWSWDGQELSFQARNDPAGVTCGQIFRMRVLPNAGAPIRMALGEGALTSARSLPDGQLVYSSTHLVGSVCPGPTDLPDRSLRVLPDTDIFSSSSTAAGSAPQRLTATSGFDGEAAVCSRDGSIVFTSVRDGDLDLYRMDRDGKNLRRLTRTLGYDGGASFNHDCSQVAWRAGRPRTRTEIDDYRQLLARGLVRPSRLEIWSSNADGSEARQLTDLDAASFDPVFHPTENVVVFASNVGDRRAGQFDLWAMNGNGTGLRRLTYAPGFDGSPRFSPDGHHLAFSSNRASAPDKSDTDLFVARWNGLPALDEEAWRPADRIARDVTWLAHPEREGRGIGTKGLSSAGAYLEARLRELGALPAGDNGGYREEFSVTTAIAIAPGTAIAIAGRTVQAGDLAPLGFSASGTVAGDLVLAGYGVVSPEHAIDDFAGLDVAGKAVLVRRFAPEDGRIPDAGDRRRLGDLRQKASHARKRGARALLVVDWPMPPPNAPTQWQPAAEAPLPAATTVSAGDVGIPVVVVRRAALAPAMADLVSGKPVAAHVRLDLSRTLQPAFNVVGKFPGRKPERAIVLGAHYDHLGHGGRFSLAPDRREPHLGADDNASGTAALLEIARGLSSRRTELQHDVVIAFFSGEETGLLGSSHHVRARSVGPVNTLAMINLDMVGRLREARLDVLGAESATEWSAIVRAACADMHLTCNLSGDGQGPSDQASFYAVGIPVIHFFTGTHPDYHKPTDTAARVFPLGAAMVAELSSKIVRALDVGISLTFQRGKGAPPFAGDARVFQAFLGTIPDYGGPPNGRPGVLLAGVRPGSGADRAGLKRGDILVGLGNLEIRSVADLMSVLEAARPGQSTRVRALRDGQLLELEAKYQEARRAP